MTENKTRPSDADINAFLEAAPENRRDDARALDALFRRVTGFEPKIWGVNIVGYGRYHYVYNTGHSGDAIATGFSPRKREFSVYIMPGYTDFGHILERLGKHRIGKSCLYFTKLSNIDEAVLEELIRAGLKDLATRWEIHPE